MYDHILKVHGQYLAKEQDVPADAEADGNGPEMDFSGTLGGVEILAVAATDLALADGATLAVRLEHADKGGDFETLGQVCAVTASGALTIEAGEVLGRFIPPTSAKARTKAVLATDDATATGTLSVFPHYLAR
ncbi:hypothetical protein [Desulfocurvus sp. DL9XJH121]